MNTIINDSFQNVIAELDFDVIVTDAPYGVQYGYDGYEDSEWNLKQSIASLTPYLDRAAVFTGVQNNDWWPHPKWRLCWVEPSGNGSGPWGFTCWQPINVYGPDPYLQDGKGRRPDTYNGKGQAASNGSHPVAKPLSVMRWIIERTTRPGDVILDPFAGSGTTAVAAQESGRDTICVEQSAEYCQVIEDRLRQGTFEIV